MNYEFNKENFDKIMNVFVKLNKDLQRKKIIEELQFLITYQAKLCMVNYTNFTALYNKEIGDLDAENVSEKDYLEAVFAYLWILKSADFQFVESWTKKLISMGGIE